MIVFKIFGSFSVHFCLIFVQCWSMLSFLFRYFQSICLVFTSSQFWSTLLLFRDSLELFLYRGIFRKPFHYASLKKSGTFPIWRIRFSSWSGYVMICLPPKKWVIKSQRRDTHFMPDTYIKGLFYALCTVQWTKWGGFLRV